ncbi:hypothetical protein [Spiroplasma platyhelix]|uniref:Uncharacterized protein n=1 Tax=Spiroplasma platyhelix PALS-1 TaxID=1276218 RepID=A0A846UE26_9MOLU|nr:hypothetical protein [Spiroplasma platyhelix]MBE4704366.1 hypothetical protein [Spiroplasma platyhelix PALS-1]NKE38738.1 hypothetical protein [Spiroplasma platyhelix PALS-1]UJB28949.1 hypothetical protein SPLAT_v1c01840 [Spiroplasma platyhelix PALS-1]
MKNLLSVLGIIAIAGSAPAVLVNSNQQSENFSQQYYWNGSHSNEARSVTASPSVNGETNRSVLTLNLGSQKPNFSSFSFNGNHDINLSWGGDSYGPYNVNFGGLAFGSNNNEKVTEANTDAIDKYSTIEIFNERYSSGLAKLDATIYFGYTWYYESGNYYFQLLVNQFVNPMNSFSSATLDINLGVGAILS